MCVHAYIHVRTHTHTHFFLDVILKCNHTYNDCWNLSQQKKCSESSMLSVPLFRIYHHRANEKSDHLLGALSIVLNSQWMVCPLKVHAARAECSPVSHGHHWSILMWRVLPYWLWAWSRVCFAILRNNFLFVSMFVCARICVCAHACEWCRCLCWASALPLESQALVSAPPAWVLGTAPSALLTAKSSISRAHCAGFVPEMAMGNPSRSAICYSHAAQSVLAPTTIPVT